MCGIVGALALNSWGLLHKEKSVVEEMLIADVLRGKDGTGLAIWDNNQEVRTLKVGDHPFSLFADKQYSPFWEKHKQTKHTDLAIIGHNRAKSVGSVSTDNAHPFRHGHITMVHNGTLRQYSQLPNFKDFEVDSQALCHAIAEIGIDEALAKTHGSYAIVYFDDKEGTINFIRNKERPLSMAVDSKEKRVFFASEAAMLKWILARNRIDGVVISSVKEDTLISMKLEEFKYGDPMPEPTIREIRGPSVYSYFRNPAWQDYVDEETYEASRTLHRHRVAEARPVEKEGPLLEKAVSYVLQREKNKDQKKLPALLDSSGKVIKFESKAVRKGVMKAAKVLRGNAANVIKEVHGCKKGDAITFTVNNYIEENVRTKKECFIVEGKSMLLPETIVKFRVEGLDALEDCFNRTKRLGEITNIVEYPENKTPDPRYVVWLSNVETAPNVDDDETAEVTIH